MTYPIQLLILCPLLFLAGFGDAIAGGGGTISVPSLMLIGLPTTAALGTNKMAMSVGTVASVYQYGKNGRIVWATALHAALGAFTGAALGAKVTILAGERIMNIALLILLPAVFLFLCLKKSFGGGEFLPRPATPRSCALAAFCGLFIGFYDGFFGPGAGTFYIMALTGVLQLSLPEASGDSKVANLSSNVGALVTFLLNKAVLWRFALPGILFTVSGNYLGSRLAIKNGAKFIRPVMAIMILLLFLKTFINIF